MNTDESADYKPTYRFKTLQQIEDLCKSNLVSHDDKIYNDCIVYVYMIRSERMYYLACPNDKCNRKVFEAENEKFRCETCGKNYDDANPRYMLSTLLTDSSSQIWATFYDKEAQALLSRSAQDFRQLKESSQDSLISEMLKENQFKEVKVRIKSSLDTYMGDTKIRHGIFKIFEGAADRDLQLCHKELELYLEQETK